MASKPLEKQSRAEPVANRAESALPTRSFEAEEPVARGSREMPGLEQAERLGHDFGRLITPGASTGPPVQSKLHTKLWNAELVAGGEALGNAEPSPVQPKLEMGRVLQAPADPSTGADESIQQKPEEEREQRLPTAEASEGIAARALQMIRDEVVAGGLDSPRQGNVWDRGMEMAPTPRPPVGAEAPIQKDDVTRTEISETTDTGNKYTQDLVLNKTKARISITLGINWVKKGTWADDDTYDNFIRRVKTVAYSYLDNKFKVVCTPKDGGSDLKPIHLPIDFLIYDDSSGYKIDVHGGHPPGGTNSMSPRGGKIFECWPNGNPHEEITYAHEFGHALLGVSDEYANPRVPHRVLTNEHSIMANYFAQGIDQAEFKARHFQHIATEVAEAFAGYNCGIQEM